MTDIDIHVTLDAIVYLDGVNNREENYKQLLGNLLHNLQELTRRNGYGPSPTLEGRWESLGTDGKLGIERGALHIKATWEYSIVPEVYAAALREIRGAQVWQGPAWGRKEAPQEAGLNRRA